MEDRAARLAWFKTTVLPHEGFVRSRLRRLCPAGFDIDNLVAESLARAYAAKDFSRITAGRSYLFTIARNLRRGATPSSRSISSPTSTA
jgi:RNA polymerase sigma-70 factor (ECF subfamily)